MKQFWTKFWLQKTIHLLGILALMMLNSLRSKSLSSSTLVRGCELLRGASMSIESDPQMVEMQRELDQLVATSLTQQLIL